MPAKTRKQQGAAGAEMRRRKQDAKRQKKATRPFGSISMKALKDFVRQKNG